MSGPRFKILRSADLSFLHLLIPHTLAPFIVDYIRFVKLSRYSSSSPLPLSICTPLQHFILTYPDFPDIKTMHSPTLILLLLSTSTSLVTATWIPWKTSTSDCDDEPTPLPPAYPIETDCETTTTTPKWHPHPPIKTPWTTLSTKIIPQPVSSWTYSFTISVPGHGHPTPSTAPSPPPAETTYVPPVPPYPTTSPSLSLSIGTPGSMPPKPTPSPSPSKSEGAVNPSVPTTTSSAKVYPNSTMVMPSPTKSKPSGPSLGNATATPPPQQVSGAVGKMGLGVEVVVAALVGLGVLMASL